LRGRKLRSDKYAAAVDHHHALRTLPATRLADRCASFFAVTNVASRNTSFQSNSLRSSSCPSSFRHACKPHTLLFPTPQSPPASGPVRILIRQITPPGATERLPDMSDWMPTGDLAHPGDALETKALTPSIALHLTTPAASS
jgi:hypothetical protein